MARRITNALSSFWQELRRPTRSELPFVAAEREPYPGLLPADYRRTLGDSRVLFPLLIGVLVLCAIAYFIYFQFTSCQIFCLRLIGQAEGGELNCDERLPATVTADGIEEGFVERVLQLAARAQRNNRIILSSMYLPEGVLWSYYFKPHLFIVNFLEYLQDAFPDAHPLIVCNTAYTCDVLRSYHDRFGMSYTVVRDRSNWQCNAPRYIKRVADLKYLYSYTLLKYGGYDVLLVDPDAVMVHNPFPYLDEPVEGGPADVQVLTDSLDPAGGAYWQASRAERLREPDRNLPACILGYPVSPSYCASTGFMLLRANDRTLALVRHVLDALHDPAVWDQAEFNIVLPRLMSETGLKLEVLDGFRFNNIKGFEALMAGNYSVPQANWLLVHAGHMHGPNEKIAGLRKYGYWRPNNVFPLPT